MSVKYNNWQTGWSNLKSVDIASFLKRTLSESEDTVVEKLITSVEKEVCRRTNRQFEEDTEYYQDVDGGFTLFRSKLLPLSSMTSIKIDGTEKISLYTKGTNYWIYDDRIRFLNYVTGSTYSFKSVRITYTISKFWGDDIKTLIKKMVAKEFLFSEKAGIPLSNFAFGDGNESYDNASFNKYVDDTLFSYTIFNL